jgi:YVTN family beta-propeller protein
MRGLRTSAWILALLFAFLPIAQAKVIYAYVANLESGTVSVINTSTNKVVKTIPVGIRAFCLAINRAASFVYVASYNPNTGKSKISVISTSSNSVVATFPSVEASYIAFSLSGKTAYMTTVSGGYYVYVLNTVTKKYMVPIKVQNGASALAVTPDGKFLYVVNSVSGTVSVISLATNNVVTNIALLNLQGSPSEEIAISPDGSTAYVTFYNFVNPSGPSGVQVIETATNTVVNTINVPDSPGSAKVSPDGRWLYVPQNGLGSVAVIDTSTQTVTNTIPVYAFSPSEVAFTPNGAFAYVVDTSGVSVINTATQIETGQIYLAYSVGIAVMGTW